jgi:ribosomal protein S18 acetylase RimI-like enzyme
MTLLCPMPPERYASYMEAAMRSYARENVAAGRWPAQDADERSRADFMALLPQGLATPDQHLFEIRATEDGPPIGHLWFAVEQRLGTRSAFVFDLEILAPYRRRGHAERAFRALEAVAAGLQLSGIGLHVFVHNTAAQALYRKLGYQVTGLNMLKTLAAGGD